MCSSLGSLPPELWDSIMHHLKRDSLVKFSIASPCCTQMVRCHVKHRIVYHLSSRAPFKLKMILSDPVTMERCEALDLTRPRDIATRRFFEEPAHSQEQLILQANYTRLEIAQDQGLDKPNLSTMESGNTTHKAPHDNYIKTIELDQLDFLYQLCFDIHKYNFKSFILVDNYCGQRMRTIRLWRDWFTNSEIQYTNGYKASCSKLFTKLVWTDSEFDVGFIISAYESIPPETISSRSQSEFQKGPLSNSRFYQIRIEEMVIRSNYLLGLFEGFRS